MFILASHISEIQNEFPIIWLLENHFVSHFIYLLSFSLLNLIGENSKEGVLLVQRLRRCGGSGSGSLSLPPSIKLNLQLSLPCHFAKTWWQGCCTHVFPFPLPLAAAPCINPPNDDFAKNFAIYGRILGIFQIRVY